MKEDADKFIQSLKDKGLVVRVLTKSSCYTHDYRPQRANVVVDGNRVIRYWRG